MTDPIAKQTQEQKLQKKPKLLIIDDDVELSEVLESYFRPRGYDVLRYNNPLEAIEQMSRKKIEPDIVVSDLLMPDIDGIELIKRFKQINPSIPIILLTAQQTLESALSAIEAGAYDFVVKPVPFPQLHLTIRRGLHFHELQRENSDLRKTLEVSRSETLQGVIIKSPSMKKIFELAQRAARSSSTILLTGQSGSGKEILAKAIHSLSPRKDKPFIAINCSAIPENLLESELFGHSKGAFTGAFEKKIGLIEEAEGGTLFLDEIGDMSLPLQAKLLRVLQERRIRRVGENDFREFDVRFIAATHKDLKVAVAEKNFREDLFYRLNVIPIHIPPLSERIEDVLPLADHFLKKYSSPENPVLLTPDAKEYILKRKWNGNVRELENLIERSVVLITNNTIDIDDLIEFDQLQDTTPPTGALSLDSLISAQTSVSELISLEQLNLMYIQFVLKKTNGAKEHASKILGIDRKTLYRKLLQLHSTSETEEGVDGEARDDEFAPPKTLSAVRDIEESESSAAPLGH